MCINIFPHKIGRMSKSLAIFSQVPKSLIAIVVGKITEDLKSAAAALKNTGVQIFVVAVTVKTPSSRHLSLASGSNFMHTVSSLDELGYLSARLTKDTCEGKLKPPYAKRRTGEFVVELVFCGQNLIWLCTIRFLGLDMFVLSLCLSSFLPFIVSSLLLTSAPCLFLPSSRG